VLPFKGIFCDDISEFESHMPSHAVGLSQVAQPGNRHARRVGLQIENTFGMCLCEAFLFCGFFSFAMIVLRKCACAGACVFSGPVNFIGGSKRNESFDMNCSARLHA
jgi:hypothetical protein